NAQKTAKSTVESAVGKTANALVGLVKAAGDVAKAVAGNDGTKIGESVANGAGANANSVKGIATGMKGIIDAATEGGVKFETAAVVDVNNKNAGKLFGTRGGGGGDAVAGDTTKHDGKKGDDAENAIQAAIGGSNQQRGEAFADNKLGKKNDQIAAALVLRGMA
ncbi:variable large family protein, partial [Borreliella garinii]|uniref:variable large family protein n=1 Tax=Borreliella garinii TaxID=29519 RepID=UPI001AEFB2F8